MGISRREFFRSIFSRKTFDAINPLSTRELSHLLDLSAPVRAESCEDAGLALMKIKTQRESAGSGAAEFSNDLSRPISDQKVGPLCSGE